MHDIVTISQTCRNLRQSALQTFLGIREPVSRIPEFKRGNTDGRKSWSQPRRQDPPEDLTWPMEALAFGATMGSRKSGFCSCGAWA